MKKCRIINDTFCYVLFVDDRQISFEGMDAAEYFRQHYTDLGYEVEFDMDYYKTKENT